MKNYTDLQSKSQQAKSHIIGKKQKGDISRDVYRFFCTPENMKNVRKILCDIETYQSIKCFFVNKIVREIVRKTILTPLFIFGGRPIFSTF
jgi:hypothetical protein